MAKEKIQGGIGLYDTFVHVDVRGPKARWRQDKSTGGREVNVAGWAEAVKLPGTVKEGSRGKDVENVQRLIGGLKDDGIFGARTKAAVMVYQKANDLRPDGVVGDKTWGKLLKV